MAKLGYAALTTNLPGEIIDATRVYFLLKNAATSEIPVLTTLAIPP